MDCWQQRSTAAPRWRRAARALSASPEPRHRCEVSQRLRLGSFLPPLRMSCALLSAATPDARTVPLHSMPCISFMGLFFFHRSLLLCCHTSDAQTSPHHTSDTPKLPLVELQACPLRRRLPPPKLLSARFPSRSHASSGPSPSPPLPPPPREREREGEREKERERERD